MATKTRKKSAVRGKSSKRRITTIKSKKRSVRRKKGFLDKCLAIFD